MSVLQMSFSASVLIIAVMIIRALVLHKLSKKTFLVLWGVVVCRLLIPFSVPSRFSFFTGLSKLNQVFSHTMDVTVPVGVTGNMDHSTGYNLALGTSTASVSPITIIWLIGMSICALLFFAIYIKCRVEFQTSLPVENDFTALWLKEHPMRRAIQIKQCDKIKAPLTYGVFQPVILLPKATDWKDETKLKYILTHEFVHIRRFDTLSKLLLAFTISVHWFNPLVWAMYVLANRDIELSCDEAVVRIFGENVKSTYAMVLIDMAEKKNKLTPLCNNFSKNAIEERIVSIMKIKKASLAGIVLAIALVIGTTTAFATNAAAPDNSMASVTIPSTTQNITDLTPTSVSDPSAQGLFTVSYATSSDDTNSTTITNKTQSVEGIKPASVTEFATNAVATDNFTASIDIPSTTQNISGLTPISVSDSSAQGLFTVSYAATSDDTNSTTITNKTQSLEGKTPISVTDPSAHDFFSAK